MSKARIRSSILILAILIAAALGVLRWQLSPRTAGSPASTPGAEKQHPTPASLAGGPSIAAPPASTAAAIQTAEFEKMARDGLDQLARQDSVREEVKQDPHGVPRSLIASGLLLGRIAEAVSKNPALKPRALEFYSECAASKNLANSIRALCLARFNRLEGGAESSKLTAGIPESVRNLAEHAGL
jgi:hypothetical protein